MNTILRGSIAGLAATLSMSALMLAAKAAGLMRTAPPKQITHRAGQKSGAAPAQGASSFAQHKAALEGQNQPAPAPQIDVKIAITGIATDDVQVAQLMSHLSKCSLFQKVNLVISDVYSPNGTDSSKADKGPKLRKWQIEMMLNPQAEVREDPKTAAVELSK